MVHVPYRGDAQSVTSLLSGDVPVIIGSNKSEFNMAAADPLVREGTAQSIDAFLAKRYAEKKDAYVAAVKQAYPTRTQPADLVDIVHNLLQVVCVKG